ncbi:bifunctional lysylphosphatidylglycerol flippase/synthetase MprF [Anaeromyxobacter sp. Red801]|uniref:bifunctional lysylphosphatidylglycerol flippase/synthetase MprF n=1 Tax=Anaeromyxobacter sp. Red801 TaxID=3411632 RepID=UPI003BA19C74
MTWLRRAALVLLPVALLGAAAWTLHAELRGLHLHQVERELSALPAALLALAAGLTALDYLLLSAYDVLALRYAGRRLPYTRVVFTSFVSYAFGNNVGFALLSSGSVRFRLYSQWGLSALEITRVVAFTAAQLWAGLLPIAGVALLSGLPVPLPGWAAHALGAAALAITASYVVAAARGTTLSVKGVRFALPSLPLTLAQIAVSAADWALAALVLHVLLPAGSPLGFVQLLGLFVAAQVVGLASQVPGGLGVFESIVLAALTPAVPAPAVVSSLVAFRLVYYVAPFLLAFALLATHELLLRRAWLGRVLRGAHASFAPVVPWLAGGAALLAGTVLLVSGATPAEAERLHLLRRALPLPVLEASHLVGSLVGTALLLLARALVRRIDAAWAVAIGLLAAGAVASLAKGLDWEEATLLVALLAAIAPFHRQFYRRSSMLEGVPSAGWALGVALLVAGSIAIGVLSYRHVEWSRDLWFTFAFHGDAPRFLRASVAGVSLLVLFGVATLLRPAPPEPPRTGATELDRVRPLVDRAPESYAHLALTGDKCLLFAEGDAAFLMYAVEGRSWVAMGDPVGPDPAATELAWRFRELSDRHGGWACFYQVGPAALPRYLDLGLSLLKLGEEAVVPLEGFSLDGSARRGLRQAHARAERDGLSFEVAPAPAVPGLLPDLAAVSDAWLTEKGVREKGFSLGSFDPRYLAEGPVALVRLDGKIVGFANVWASAARVELSVDLMRYHPSAPRSTMDYLFTSLMLWGRAEGYRAFNLGMAPFSGFEPRQLAPLWTRMGARLYRHGENFYNFQGLRAYKEKFAPEWRPRWLAAPGGLRLPAILANLAALVSRGLKGVVTR